ncbi:41676_t:CDS:2, partial [Gigaspora margarita]
GSSDNSQSFFSTFSVCTDLALGGLGAFPNKRKSAISSGLEIGARLNSYLR